MTGSPIIWCFFVFALGGSCSGLAPTPTGIWPIQRFSYMKGTYQFLPQTPVQTTNRYKNLRLLLYPLLAHVRKLRAAVPLLGAAIPLPT